MMSASLLFTCEYFFQMRGKSFSRIWELFFNNWRLFLKLNKYDVISLTIEKNQMLEHVEKEERSKKQEAVL